MPFIFLCFGLVFALIASQASRAQNRPFEKYNFEDGGYMLVGLFEHHNDHAVQKKVGEFYTDDLAVLNAIKKAWNFPRRQKIYACGYHYHVVVLRNGKKIDDVSINLECEQIVTGEGSWVFNSSLLTRFSTRLKRLISKSDEFVSVERAREYWTQIKQKKDFVYAYEPLWLNYEGSFRFRTQCPKADFDCYMTGKDSNVLETVRAKIAAAYPGEKFDLRTRGGTSAGDIFFEIHCDKSLDSKFDLYDRWNKEHFGKWQPFPLMLQTFWKEK